MVSVPAANACRPSWQPERSRLAFTASMELSAPGSNAFTTRRFSLTKDIHFFTKLNGQPLGTHSRFHHKPRAGMSSTHSTKGFCDMIAVKLARWSP